MRILGKGVCYSRRFIFVSEAYYFADPTSVASFDYTQMSD